MKRPNTRAKAGLDLVEIDRFRKLSGPKNRHARGKLFLASEIEYCMAYTDAAPHFAGIFAAKEAVSKALGTEKYPFVQIEIRHAVDGAPEAWFAGKRLPVSISVSHTSELAAAIAIR